MPDAPPSAVAISTSAFTFESKIMQYFGSYKELRISPSPEPEGGKRTIPGSAEDFRELDEERKRIQEEMRRFALELKVANRQEAWERGKVVRVLQRSDQYIWVTSKE